VAKRGEETHTRFVAARLTAAELTKLERLARETQRNFADVLRVLIRNAEVQRPDIWTCLDAPAASVPELGP
jgi:hypothetical protein